MHCDVHHLVLVKLFLPTSQFPLSYKKKKKKKKKKKQQPPFSLLLPPSLSTISKSEMSRSNRKSTNVELRLNVPRQRAGAAEEEEGSSASVSPPSSCISSEEGERKRSESPKAPPMVVVGCPRCLMYVMLSEEEPKCPKCNSTVLLDFHHGNTSKSKKS